MSRVSGFIEKPSALMWCTTTTSTCSVGVTASSRIRRGTAAVTSKPREIVRATASATSDSRTGSAARSTFTRSAGRITWLAAPSISGNTVRSDSCRSITSDTASRRASTSSAPVSRIATTMLFAADPVSKRLRNHIRCCAIDSGSVSGRSCATSGARVSPPAATAASTSAASCATVGASKKSRTSMRMPRSALMRATTRVALSELPPSAK